MVVNTNNAEGVDNSMHISNSKGVNFCGVINNSKGVNHSTRVNCSDGANKSNGVNWSEGVSRSNGVNKSNGVIKSYGIAECEGVSRCIFCYKKSGELMIFNKKTTKERFDEVLAELLAFDWRPFFDNEKELVDGLEWYATSTLRPIKADSEIVWSSMPKEMLDYIKSLPEFNQKIFNKITGVTEK